jgi:hypothetical protein
MCGNAKGGKRDLIDHCSCLLNFIQNQYQRMCGDTSLSRYAPIKNRYLLSAAVITVQLILMKPHLPIANRPKK